MSDTSHADAFTSDLLARKPFSQELERFLLTEHHFVEGGLVVSLNAPFGSGKTTFLRMWAGDLAERRKQNAKLPRPIIINAWESDYCGDPMLAMVSALSQALVDPATPEPDTGKADSIRDAAKNVFWFGLGLANNFVSQTTGIDAVAAGELAAAKKQQRQAETAQTLDALRAFEGRTAALEKLKQALAAAFGDTEPQALVFIDELDRCRPDYAIGYLETIKHIFDVHGIVFVLAVDERQLSSTAAVLFGGQLNFPEYYRKFSHRTISLPIPESAATNKLVRAYCERYLFQDSKRGSALRLEHRNGEKIAELFSAFQLRPRQIQEAFRILGHAAASPLDKKLEFTSWTFEVCMLFMSALRVENRTAYEKLGAGQMTPAELNKLLRSLAGGLKSHEWWFSVLVSSFPNSQEIEKTILDEMVQSGWIKVGEGDTPDLGKILGEFKRGWNRYRNDDSGLGRVYAHIEGLKNFGG